MERKSIMKRKPDVVIVAELGSNWDPVDPLESCRQLIQAAAGAGADAVKMQDWHPIEEMDRPVEWKKRCGPWTLPPGVLPILRRHALGQGVDFLCSVFTLSAVARAVRNRYPAIKVASSEIGNEALLRRMGRLSVDFWISTGGATYKAVEWALRCLGGVARRHTTLLHCTTEYPTPPERAAIGRVAKLARRFGTPVGWSSHVAYPDAVGLAAEAARLGATVVEAHFRAEGVTPDNAPDNGPWALWPEEFAELAEAVKSVG